MRPLKGDRSSARGPSPHIVAAVGQEADLGVMLLLEAGGNPVVIRDLDRTLVAFSSLVLSNARP